MGTAPSQILSEPLSALPKPVAAVDPTYCCPTPMTLQLTEQTVSTGKQISVHEVSSEKLHFRIDCAAVTLTNRKVLVDANEKPVVHIRNPLLSFNSTYNISSDPESREMLFRIKAKTTMSDAVFECEFRDAASGVGCKAGLRGDSLGLGAVVWVEHGNDERRSVARIRRSTTVAGDTAPEQQDYYIDVSKNADMVLVVLLCVALDTATKTAAANAAQANNAVRTTQIVGMF